MKVYISFDIEGVTGITDNRDIDEKSPFFNDAMKLGTGDVNAAIEGALDAGASEIIVYDGHGVGRRNLIYEAIHPKAKLLRGRLSNAGMNMPAFDDTYDAVFFIGWHARASAPGVMSHCLNSRVFAEWKINDSPVGEPELAAALAGEYQVPLVLFTGDDKACEEVKNWCPECELVVTKFSLDRYTALCLSKENTYDLIRRAASSAVDKKNNVPPFKFSSPIVVEASTFDDHVALALSEIPGIKRIAPRTVTFKCLDYKEAFRTIHVMQMVSFAAIE